MLHEQHRFKQQSKRWCTTQLLLCYESRREGHTHLFCCSCCRSWTAIFLRSSTSFSSSSSSSASCSLSELGKVRNKITIKWLIRDISRCGHTSIYYFLHIQFSLSQLPQGKVCPPPPKTGHQCVAGPAHLQTHVESPVNLLCLSLVSGWDMQMIKGGNLLAPLIIEVADWCERQCNSVESHQTVSSPNTSVPNRSPW